jgi:FkbM family methyltransferase
MKLKLLIKRSISNLLLFLNLDTILAAYARKHSLLRKFVPKPHFYKREKFDFAITDNLTIQIDRNDYTQWRVFSGLLSFNVKLLPFLREADNEALVVLDIGANIGAYSILMAIELPERKIEFHLFEPNPRIYPTMVHNVKELEKSLPGVRALPNNLALGDKATTLTLRFESKHSGAGSLAQQHHFDEEIDVQVIALDTYAEMNALDRIHVLKIDVESFEPAVIRGGLKTISKFKPMIYFEYTRSWFDNFTTEYIAKIIEFMRDEGYVFYIEKDQGFLDFSMSIETLRGIKYSNFLAVSRELNDVSDS